MLTVSCDLGVKEYPVPEPVSTVDAEILITHDKTWGYLTHTIGDKTRSLDNDSLDARYLIKIFEKGTNKNPIAQHVVYADDTDKDSLRITLPMQPGEWDIRVWRDIVRESDKTPVAYNADNFARIEVATPYFGSSTSKEAFSGILPVSVPIPDDGKPLTHHYTVNLSRPAAAYVLIARDLQEFLKVQQTRADQSVDLSAYSVTVRYPEYLPNVYHHFSGNTIDAATGVSFKAGLTQLSDSTTIVAFDHILASPDASAVKLQFEIRNSHGESVATSGILTIPLRQRMCTLVYGNLLTVRSGLIPFIDTKFQGDFNIYWH